MGDNRKLWTLLGLTAGAAAGVWLWQRGTERAWQAAGAGAPGDAVAVGPVETGDPALRLDRTLGQDLELAPFALAVRGVSDGVVEITGEVDAPEQRARAVAMAHNIAGIHTVVNRIRLRDDGSES